MPTLSTRIATDPYIRNLWVRSLKCQVFKPGILVVTVYKLSLNTYYNLIMVTHRSKRSAGAAVAKTALSAYKSRLPSWPILLTVLLFAAAGGYFLHKSFAANANLPGDINNDNTVNLTDLSLLLSKWNGTDSNTDINGDGKINLTDLSLLLSNWNKTYTPPTPPTTPPSTPPTTPPTPPPTNPDEYLENEQFNGTSLSGTKWVAKTYGKAYRNNEEQDYRPGQAKVEDGNLVITAVKDSSGWHSGEVESTWQLRYGEYESRMRMSAKGQGIWPAIWLLSGTGGWPGGGEIDIMEAISNNNWVQGTIHAGPSHWQLYKQFAPFDTTQWHVYKTILAPGKITIFVDNQQYAEFTSAQKPSGATWPFDSNNYYGILNIAMGGEWPGDTTSATPNPVSMYVDYFTVKKLP